MFSVLTLTSPKSVASSAINNVTASNNLQVRIMFDNGSLWGWLQSDFLLIEEAKVII